MIYMREKYFRKKNLTKLSKLLTLKPIIYSYKIYISYYRNLNIMGDRKYG